MHPLHLLATLSLLTTHALAAPAQDNSYFIIRMYSDKDCQLGNEFLIFTPPTDKQCHELAPPVQANAQAVHRGAKLEDVKGFKLIARGAVKGYIKFYEEEDECKDGDDEQGKIETGDKGWAECHEFQDDYKWFKAGMI